MADDTPTTAAIKTAKIALAKQQDRLRVSSLGEDAEWLSEMEVDRPGLASALLAALCSTDDAAYVSGTELAQAHKDAALIDARHHNAANVPTAAAAARIWITPLLRILKVQAEAEDHKLDVALESHQPLLVPHRAIAPPLGAAAPAAGERETTSARNSRLLSEYSATAQKQGVDIMSIPPEMRLAAGVFALFPDSFSGSIQLPRLSEISKIGLAGDAIKGAEKFCSFTLATVQALFVRYCSASAAGITLGPYDAVATKLLVTVGPGTEERVPFMDASALRMLEAKISYPLGMIRDDSQREKACNNFYVAIQSAFSTLGTGTITHALMTKVANHDCLREAQSVVSRQNDRSGGGGSNSTDNGNKGGKRGRGDGGGFTSPTPGGSGTLRALEPRPHAPSTQLRSHCYRDRIAMSYHSLLA